MSSDVEEHQEVVDKYYYAPELNKIAPARQLAVIDYSRDLVKLHKKDKDGFGSFARKVTDGAFNEIANFTADSLQTKLTDINIEVTLANEVKHDSFILDEKIERFVQIEQTKA